jgi:anaerobic dimethyl sulfoxide reductase subunit B (iron-sulfur subunit)
MSRHGILIDYDFCCGCHTCEIACQKEHDLPVGVWGIKVMELGPYHILEMDKYIYEYIPVPTELCDYCGKRQARGELPTCVKHCQTACMKYGPVEELVVDLKSKPKQLLICPN